MTIRYLKNNQINRDKWDNTIRKSYNKMVYAFSWYLDIVFPNWSALVLGDYEFIMPVPAKKKFLIKIALQPFFAQQLGIFSPKKITGKIALIFFKELEKRFRYAELNMNKFIRVEESGFSFRSNTTYELDLILPYDQIKKNYNENTRRNLKKTTHLNIHIVENIPVSLFLDFYKKYTGEQVGLSEKAYQKIKKIISLNRFPDFSPLFFGAFQGNKLTAAAFFIKSSDRIYYLFPASSPTGRETFSMFLLIDQVIQKYAGKNLVLDFEGSNIESIARFYHGFGAKPFSYDTLIINRLPFNFKEK